MFLVDIPGMNTFAERAIPAAPAAPEGVPAVTDHTDRLRGRNVVFFLLVVLILYLFRNAERTLLHYALWADTEDDQYSYTLAIPLISAALVFAYRRKIFAEVQYDVLTLTPFLLAGVAVGWFSWRFLPLLGAGEALSIKILALVICWLAGFAVCYGSRALRSGAFPLLFLLLTTPIPDALLDRPIMAVRIGSTGVCDLILRMLGVQFQRSGFEFQLSNIAIVVAKECSGIHSMLAIFIISLLAGHLFLASVWRRLGLVLAALPIVCVTNGLRIAGLTLLAQYVNPSFLQGPLHKEGGMGFFLLALLLLSAVLQLFRKRQNAVAGNVQFPLKSNGHA